MNRSSDSSVPIPAYLDLWKGSFSTLLFSVALSSPIHICFHLCRPMHHASLKSFGVGVNKAAKGYLSPYLGPNTTDMPNIGSPGYLRPSRPSLEPLRVRVSPRQGALSEALNQERVQVPLTSAQDSNSITVVCRQYVPFSSLVLSNSYHVSTG